MEAIEAYLRPHVVAIELPEKEPPVDGEAGKRTYPPSSLGSHALGADFHQGYAR
jgi:hypothetical protein